MTGGPTHADVLAAIAASPRLAAVHDYVIARIDGDPGHDLSHLYRVAQWTLRLAPDVDPEHAIAAALLHDLVNVPKDHPDRARASALSADAARALLPRCGFTDPAPVAAICAAIRDHSWSRGATPETPLGQALQDADRLEALGLLGVFRNISTATRMGSAFVHPTDPWAAARPLDDRRYALDHWFEKLLRLPATMQTPAGRAEAERRAAFMQACLEELATELGCPRKT